MFGMVLYSFMPSLYMYKDEDNSYKLEFQLFHGFLRVSSDFIVNLRLKAYLFDN